MSNRTLRERIQAELGSTEVPVGLLTILRTKTVEGGDRLEESMRAVVAHSRREPHNIEYQVNRDANDLTRFYLYDRWANVDAIEFHESTPHFKEGIAVLKDVIDQVESVTVLRIAAEA